MVSRGIRREPGRWVGAYSQDKIDPALKERQISQAWFHLPESTLALLQSLAAWCCQFLGLRFATPQAFMRRAFRA